MDKLLNPDFGLIIWTIVTFLVVIFVLGKFAWKPILQALEAREEKIRNDIKAAEESRLASEKMLKDYQEQMAQVEARTRALVAQAEKEAQLRRDEMLKAAQDETARLTEKTRLQLAEEQRRLVQELRTEVVNLSVNAAEKLLQRSIDKNVQEKFVQEAVGNFEKWSKDVN